ncbi:ribosomal protection-like ABC-F family protein [Pseudalkalibacillus hwajinpoensis]|uniref:ribosomal protection-like ABC-F family protein n=1 Tax=Guptibacillus hwajinpoensis TaxID=208199 RepID=UPI00325B4284
MNVISIRNVIHGFEERVLFNGITVDIHHAEKIGIVGANGAGKTTLAKMLVGEVKPNRGQIEVEGEVGYLRQSIEQGMNQSFLGDQSLLMKGQKELGVAYVRNEIDSERLSGGERLKLSLAQVFASHPEILILDEPTNHLDLKGVQWLIRELEHFKGTVLIISHDRYFLDQTINRILEIENGKVNKYAGNYTDYRYEKKQRYEAQLHQYHIQQKEKQRIEDQLTGLANWSEKAHQQSTNQEGYKEFYRKKAKKMDSQVKSKRKRLEKELEKKRIDQPEAEKKVHFQFQADGSHGKRAIEANDAGKRYGERWLFKESSFYIKYGDRIGIIGENGCGKTTLLRVLLGEEMMTEGRLWKSSSLKVGYLSQDVGDLPIEQSALEALELQTRDEVYQARSILSSMGVERSRMNVPILSLSLGERTKVKMTRILLKQYDVLVLDEPTNHLDLPSREQLEETLKGFIGTLLVVSHDYYFVDKICDHLLVFENGRLKRIEMGLSEYQAREKSPSGSSQNTREQKMLLENEISALISEISLLPPGNLLIRQLDEQLKELYKKKNRI